MLGLYWGYIGVILGLYWGIIGVVVGLHEVLRHWRKQLYVSWACRDFSLKDD